jgi:predicted pyridoxine 5'-phosphate oxidase superfamily flavin-nucleotide-binding protein
MNRKGLNLACMNSADDNSRRSPTRSAAQVIFPPSVRAAQERLGSRELQQRRERSGGFHQRVDARLIAFLARVDSFFVATATADGQPYIQHRGGPKGFLRPLGPSTLGFADFAGNRQYVTVGRLSQNSAVCLFLIDYAQPARVKVWGHASVVDNDEALLGLVADPSYRARVERVILIEIDAWDINCRQHIPRKIAAEEVARAIEDLELRIRALEAENAALKRQMTNSHPGTGHD